MSKIYLYVFSFLLIFYPTFSFGGRKDEAFTPLDKKYFKKVRKEIECDDEAFDKVFPFCSQKTADPSVGLILGSDGTRGTGTIIKSNGKAATGITAKHVLFDRKSKKPRFGEFLQGSMRVNIKGEVNCFAVLEIDEIQTMKSSQEDIALFKGRYKRTLDGLKKEELSQYITPVGDVPDRRTKRVKIHHYPLGVEEQRINRGSLDEKKRNVSHCVSTLPGSSGAPVMTADGKLLIGIHTAAGRATEEVKYTGTRLPSLRGEKFRISEEKIYTPVLDRLIRNNFTKNFKKAPPKKRKGKKTK